MHTLPEFAAPQVGGGRFAVGRIFCVGRNYAEHAREMGADPEREPPFFFIKPASCLAPGGSLAYPPRTQDLQHEVELVAAIGEGGQDIPVAQALAHVAGYAVGLDMTRRDLQGQAKDLRRPWDMGKSFDGAAPIGALAPAAALDPASARITLTVNGEVRQQGALAEMIWSVGEIIAELSTYQRLLPGDLIYTGTPAGVAAVRPGDRLVAEVTGLPALEVTIAPGAAGAARRSA
jgi:fumarylpyruvate hydrolase